MSRLKRRGGLKWKGDGESGEKWRKDGEGYMKGWRERWRRFRKS